MLQSSQKICARRVTNQLGYCVHKNQPAFGVQAANPFVVYSVPLHRYHTAILKTRNVWDFSLWSTLYTRALV